MRSRMRRSALANRALCIRESRATHSRIACYAFACRALCICEWRYAFANTTIIVWGGRRHAVREFYGRLVACISEETVAGPLLQVRAHGDVHIRIRARIW